VTQKHLIAQEKTAHCASGMVTINAAAQANPKKAKTKAQANKEKAKMTINLCGANAFPFT